MIFPRPKSEKYEDKSYSMKAFEKPGELLQFYEKYKNGNADIAVKTNDKYDEDEYTLSVNENGITIEWGKESGRFRAITSLKQLLLQYGESLPYAEIYDKPQFVRRSYMLDISRCRMPKVETIKRLIDLLAGLKYNEFQLYMDSFCFKYSAFPEYTADIDCLTAEDIEGLDSYCAERFIDLVPNQNSFGHMGKWLEKPELTHLGLGDGSAIPNTLNPLSEESIEFVDKLYSSLLPHFRSKYVSIGLDEAYSLGKFQSEQACKEYGADNVFMDYLNKISDLCEKKYGKSVMFWGDMIANYPDSHKRIPKNAIVQSWGYDLIKSQMMEKRCMDLEKMGVSYYVCPGNCVWLSFTGRFDVMSFNTRTMGEIGRDHGALGYMMTDWGCGEGHMHFPVWSLVPCALAAQYAWNVGEEQNGGMLKSNYIRDAQSYIDETVFHAPVSEILYKLQQYYLLEPQRIHSSTMCCIIFRKKLTETEYPGFFDLKECGDDFYFDNVIDYMKKALRELEEVEFDSIMKRQIKLNSNMVIMASELMKVRTNGCVSAEKCSYLTKYIDEIATEYRTLWDMENYEKGAEDFLSQLEERKQELPLMVK